MREFVALSCGFLPLSTTLKGMSLAPEVNKIGEAAQEFGISRPP